MIFSEGNGRTLHKIICLVQSAIKDGLKERKTKNQQQSLVQNSIPRLQLWFKVLLTASAVKTNIAPDRVVQLVNWEADYLLSQGRKNLRQGCGILLFSNTSIVLRTIDRMEQ